MHWSIYNFIYRLNDTHSLVYNTLSHYVLCIENSELEKIRQGDFTGYSAPELSECGILSADDEKQKMHAALMKRNSDPGTFSVWFFPTLACNFKCSYCYEKIGKNRDHASGMTMETASAAVAWCEKQISGKNIDEINITFTGGEPILNPDAIKTICTGFKNGNFPVQASYTIITNGSLLTADNIRLLSSLEINSYQITLDGAAEFHDKRRVFTDSSPSFSIIMKNIASLLKLSGSKASILIRVNIDDDNIDQLPALFAYIKRIGLHKVLVFNLGDTIKPVKSREDQARLNSLYRKIILLHDNAREMGLSINISETTPCSMLNICSIMIAPDGSIYKCPAVTGNREFAVSGIHSAGHTDSYNRMMTMIPWSDCLDCELVGICAGGCRFRQYLDTGIMDDKKNCRKYYLSRVLERQLTDQYEYSLRNSDTGSP